MLISILVSNSIWGWKLWLKRTYSIYVTYNIYQTLWEGRKYWIRSKIAINYLKVSNFKYLECVTSNYMNAGSVRKEQDGHQERKYINKFNVLLTVHHAMILGNCPTWRTNSFQCIYLFIVLYMFRACHAHHQEKQIVSIQLYSQPAHDTATNTEWQLPEAVLIQFVSSDDEHDMLETCREL